MRQISRRNGMSTGLTNTHTVRGFSDLYHVFVRNNAFSVLHYVITILYVTSIRDFSAPATIAHGSIGLFGHFRVTKSLTFKMRLGAQPFL